MLTVNIQQARTCELLNYFSKRISELKFLDRLYRIIEICTVYIVERKYSRNFSTVGIE